MSGEDQGEIRPLSPARVALLFALGTLVTAALVFVPAGTIHWPRGQLWLALLIPGYAVHTAILQRINPTLGARRLRVGEGTPVWDRVLLGLLRLGFGGAMLAPALAFRHGEPPLGWGLAVAGGVMHLAAQALLTWAMGVNAFFEGTVRVQRESGHRVIDTGPYAFVRHPGYVAFSLMALAAPLVLGSARGLPWALGVVAVMVTRTALEDRFLRRDLDGYEAYARRVRWRLVPWVW